MTSSKEKASASKSKKSNVPTRGPLRQSVTAVGGLNRDLLRSFTEFMREEGLVSFTFRSQEFEVELKFAGSEAPVFAAPPVTSGHTHSKNAEPPRVFSDPAHETHHAPQANHTLVKSPFVGTFYRAPGPGKPTFVEVGQTVRTGDTLCVLEAMKLMNEIEAEFKCKILKILVDDGSPVEYGEALFEVELL